MVDLFFLISLKKKPHSKLKKLSASCQNEKKHTRKCSPLGTLLHLFRSSETQVYANDAKFEIKNYKKQKQMKKDSLSLASVSSQYDNKTIPEEVKVQHNQSIFQYPRVYTSEKKEVYGIDEFYYSRESWQLSSNLTVHSEDLTAKEFANIAGIQILPEQEENHLLKRPPIRTSYSVHLMDHIWDVNFWKHPRSKSHQLTTAYDLELPPILYELKRHKNNAFIKKGRFEVHLYTTTNIEHHIPPQKVIEWKRKSHRPVSLLNV